MKPVNSGNGGGGGWGCGLYRQVAGILKSSYIPTIFSSWESILEATIGTWPI